MSYATPADIEAHRPGELATSAPLDHTGNPDSDAVTQALEYADNRINELLSGRYSVPISPVPDSLIGMAVDLALHRLSGSTRYTEEKEKWHNDALARLREIAKGLASLPGVDEPTAEGTPGRATLVAPNDRIMNRQKLGGLL